MKIMSTNWLKQYIVVLISLLISNLSLAETFTGRFEVVISDYFRQDRSNTEYFIVSGKGTVYQLNFAEDYDVDRLETGDHITVDGKFQHTISINKAEKTPVVDVKSVSILPTISRAQAEIENRKIATFLVSFRDKDLDLYTNLIKADSALFTDTKSVNNLILKSSFEQMQFDRDTDKDGQADIFEIFVDYDIADTCDAYQWAFDAEDVAVNQGIDLSKYQHRLFLVPENIGCGWGGIANVGCNTHCRAWVRWHKSPFIYAHELGHNLDFQHASTDFDNDGVVDKEYGDQSGIMGAGQWYPHEVNAPHRIQKSWYDKHPEIVAELNESAVLTLTAMQKGPVLSLPGTQLVVLPIPDSNEKYYITYQTRYFSPFGTERKYEFQVLVHRYSSGKTKTRLISVLGLNDVFIDENNQIEIEMLSDNLVSADVRFSIGE